MIRLFCVQTYYAHWADHSGYHHFLSRLPEDISVTHLRIPKGAVRGEELQGVQKVWFRLIALWAKKRTNAWTSESDLLAEFQVFQKIKDALKEDGKIIVHFLDGEIGFNFFGILCLLLGREAKRVRLIASYHQPGSLLEKALTYKERLKKLDLVMTVGMSQLPFFDFLSEEQVRFVPHGIDTNFYCPAEYITEGETIYCLTVGHWLRDFDTLEKVIRNTPDRMVFRIVAGKEHIQRFQSLPNVELYSGIEDEELLRLYQQSDIGLMPLQESTANNALLEMMACGLPIVATRVGSVEDYLPDNAGILLSKNDPDAILDTLQRLAISPSDCSRLGKAARRRALDLGWDNIARQMSDIYREI